MTRSVEAFTENARARDLHSLGLEAALGRKDYATAYQLFDEATRALGVPLSQSLHSESSLKLQGARIIRDKGFTSLREALYGQDYGRLEEAHHSLVDSETMSAQMVQRGNETYSPEAWRFLISEHGATLGLLGRLATVCEVVQVPIEDVYEAEDYYDTAHKVFLSEGVNKYYQTSNAINAARHERINGRLTAAGIWMGRAALSVRQAKKHDPSNYEQARKTYTQRRAYLKSKRTAAASVLTKP
ncbi:hypothetical protein KW789_00105 [Candidatus Saccharibacteria bacterium]|nr:hypothetical protein [Candidatus Saccharibacteria bacterium]